MIEILENCIAMLLGRIKYYDSNRISINIQNQDEGKEYNICVKNNLRDYTFSVVVDMSVVYSSGLYHVKDKPMMSKEGNIRLLIFVTHRLRMYLEECIERNTVNDLRYLDKVVNTACKTSPDHV